MTRLEKLEASEVIHDRAFNAYRISTGKGEELRSDGNLYRETKNIQHPAALWHDGSSAELFRDNQITMERFAEKCRKGEEIELKTGEREDLEADYSTAEVLGYPNGTFYVAASSISKGLEGQTVNLTRDLRWSRVSDDVFFSDKAEASAHLRLKKQQTERLPLDPYADMPSPERLSPETEESILRAISGPRGPKGEEGPIGADSKAAAGNLKDPMHLIPMASLAPVARVLALGAKKYGERNWLLSEGVEIKTYLGAILRHHGFLGDSDDIDEESDEHHIAHIAASCIIILDALRHGKLIDNRVKIPSHD